MRIPIVKRFIVPALLAATIGGGAVARAEVPPACDAPHQIDKYQHLRRISLDLRGRIPSIEEYTALDTVESVPQSMIEQWLKTDDFRQQMRRYHEELFWPNLSAVRINGTESTLFVPTGTTVNMIQSTGKQTTYRGLSGATCDDVEQTQFDMNFPGEFRPIPVRTETVTVNGKPVTVNHEGWRMVAPYWNPTTKIKVCAYDAQETAKVVINNVTYDCNNATGRNNKACGCGPGLKFCYGPGGVTSNAVLAGLREQLGRSVDDVVTGSRPYTDLMLSTKTYENGVLAFWKKYLTPNLNFGLTINFPGKDETIQDRAFTDPSWIEINRPAIHAGVLTSPAYLLRFQTDRGRANRFRINFLCESFVPPANAMPQPGCDPNAADLTKRCICQYCHTKLEPMAAHFGLFAEAGSTAMTDEKVFPKFQQSCINSRAANCTRFYVTQTDAHRPGYLLPYQWTDSYPDWIDNIEKGPRKLAQAAIDDGSFARCTVKRIFANFVKRDMRVAGEQTDELELLDTLAKGFVSSGHSLPWLVRQVVTLPQYRRAR